MNLSLQNTGNYSFRGTNAITSNTVYLAECTYNSNGFNFYVSGNAGLSNTSNLNVSAGTTWIGAGNPTFNYFNGTIYEIIAYNTVILPRMRASIENYLCSKWDILPATQSLSIWLDGNDPYGTGIPPLPSTIIRTWTNKSLSAAQYNATASNLGSNYPTYQTGIVFAGNQNYSITNTSHLSGETAFFVISPSSTITSEQVIYSGSGKKLTVGSNYISIVTNNVLNASNTYTTSSNTNTLINYSILPTSNAILYVNGTAGTSISIGTLVSSNLIIGSSNTGTSSFKGTIREILIYNVVLSSDRRTLVEAYLSKKWGISVPPNPLSNTTLIPQPVLSNLRTSQLNRNIGYVMQPSVTAPITGNPGTSTLYYNSTGWSLN